MGNKNFKAHEKLRVLKDWWERGRGEKNAIRVARKHGTSPESLYRWDRQYTPSVGVDSLENKSKAPHHSPNKRSAEDVQVIQDVYNLYGEQISNAEAFARARIEKAFNLSHRTFLRIKYALNIAPVQILKQYEPMPYETPTMVGIKWQIDVKYVPRFTLANIPGSSYHLRNNAYRLYQYTCIDEASRKRFIFIYDEHNRVSAIDFVRRCIAFFGYKPLIIQTDNGHEFCEFTEQEPKVGRELARKFQVGSMKWHAHQPRNARLSNFERKHMSERDKQDVSLVANHPFTRTLFDMGIQHYLIKVATPRHNGKIERSHRTDNQEFYRHFKGDGGFRDLAHARECAKAWLFTYNERRGMSVHNHKTPSEVEREMLAKLHSDKGLVTYGDILRKFGAAAERIERQGRVKFIQQNIRWAQASRPVEELPERA